MFLAWVVFPLVLAAVGAGWGVLVELAAGRRLHDALLIPVGLAAVLVVAGTLTGFGPSPVAPAAVPVAGVGAVIGLVLAWPRLRIGRLRTPGRWPLIARWSAVAAIGALLAYGAPVILSGQATFAGFVKLDDTSTWFNVVDIIMAHGRSVAALPTSTFSLTFTGDIGEAYPLGAFVLLGVGHGLTGIDAAWTFQPYLACCAAALALCIYALVSPLIASPRMRALVAFIGAQPAILYGYSLWGGIKEVVAAFTLGLGAAVLAEMLRSLARGSAASRSAAAREGAEAADAEDGVGEWSTRWGPALRQALPLGIAAGALIQTLGIGAGGWVVPAFVVLVVLMAVVLRTQGGRVKALWSHLRPVGGAALITAAAVIPVWIVLSYFFSHLHAQGLLSENASAHTKFGNLLGPLSGWQLFGIWPVGDFRFINTPSPWTGLLVGLAIVGLIVAFYLSARRREYGVVLYALIASLGVGIVYFGGATPWVVGKSLALSSPALVTAALAGGAMLWATRRRAPPPIAGAAQLMTDEPPPPPVPPNRARRRERRRATGTGVSRAWMLGPVLVAAVVVGVLWSNVLAYHEATLAPRGRLAELQHIGTLVKGKGPTFINLYEVYADRHFMRGGDPIEPAEFRPTTLPTRSGAALTSAAWADLNSFDPSVLEHYRSIVTQRAPVESRPPSTYQLVWQGRYYQLWQRPAHPKLTLLEQVDYGESNSHPYCGQAEGGSSEPVCSLTPVAIPSCPQVKELGRKAEAEHALLIGYQRPAPTAIYGDDVLWPGAWVHEPSAHALIATAPGTAVAHIVVPTTQHFELFLGGDSWRGFEVSVDGRHVGDSRHELALFPDLMAHIGNLHLTAGVHKVEITYPSGTSFPEVLEPGSGWNEFTELSSIILQPMDYPRSELVAVNPSAAATLCGRELNWIDVVRPA